MRSTYTNLTEKAALLEAYNHTSEAIARNEAKARIKPLVPVMSVGDEPKLVTPKGTGKTVRIIDKVRLHTHALENASGVKAERRHARQIQHNNRKLSEIAATQFGAVTKVTTQDYGRLGLYASASIPVSVQRSKSPFTRARFYCAACKRVVTSLRTCKALAKLECLAAATCPDCQERAIKPYHPEDFRKAR